MPPDHEGTPGNIFLFEKFLLEENCHIIKTSLRVITSLKCYPCQISKLSKFYSKILSLLNSSHPPLPPWYPYVCSLHLCLYFCFVNKFVFTNFFRLHLYALIYNICFSLSDLLPFCLPSPHW